MPEHLGIRTCEHALGVDPNFNPVCQFISVLLCESGHLAAGHRQRAPGLQASSPNCRLAVVSDDGPDGCRCDTNASRCRSPHDVPPGRLHVSLQANLSSCHARSKRVAWPYSRLYPHPVRCVQNRRGLGGAQRREVLRGGTAEAESSAQPCQEPPGEHRLDVHSPLSTVHCPRYSRRCSTV